MAARPPTAASTDTQVAHEARHVLGHLHPKLVPQQVGMLPQGQKGVATVSASHRDSARLNASTYDVWGVTW